MTANSGHRILVVDDDPLIRGSLYEVLNAQNYQVEIAADGAEAMNQLKRSEFDVVLCDWKMPQVDGMGLLSHMEKNYPDTAVVLMTGFGNINSAVEAMRQGAFDYLTKPIQPEELHETLRRALNRAGVISNDNLEDPFAGIIADDPGMKKILEVVQQVAQTPTTVLLEGESGTGKRVIAQAIHRCDRKRRHGPFVEVSCGALPETLLESELFGHVKGAFTGAIRDKKGRFEVAEGGTILLDEIDAFSKNLQVKLLRVIQDRLFERVGDSRTLRADVRLIAATNRNLFEWVQQGRFREDLYYRLNVIVINLPPLRERPMDLPLLIDAFIKRTAKTMERDVTGISGDALEILANHTWPGNVRELENMIERTVILCKHRIIQPSDLPEALLRPREQGLRKMAPELQQTVQGGGGEDALQLKDALKNPERELILRVLNEVRWNRSLAAKRLGIHRSTLYQKIRQLGIES